MKTKLIFAVVIFFGTGALALADTLANADSDGLYVRSIEQVMRTEPEQIDIGTAALIVAEEWSDLVHGRRYQQQLDDMAHEILARIEEKKLTNNPRAVFIINDYLYNELGYKTVKEAGNPDDLFLNSVIENKRGYCLSLSILYLALAERLGLPLYGVVVPGHFFVRYDNGPVKFNIETTSNGANPTDEHYLEKFPFPERNGQTLYMQNLNKLQTLGCLFNNLGNVYLETENIDSAAEALEKATEINPELAESHTNLGNVYLRKERLEDAIYEYRRSIEINPGVGKTYYNLGNAYRQKNWKNDAIEAYETAIKLDPNHADSYIGLAAVYGQIGMSAKAHYLLKQAQAIQPSRAEIFLRRGDLYFQKADYKAAINQYQTALRIDPENTRAHFNIALCYNKMDMVADEILSLENALRINPDMFEALANLGNAYFGQKNYDRAIEQYEKAARVNPEAQTIYYNLGAAYLNQKKYSRAVVYYHEVIKLNPDMVEAHYNLGISYYNLKNHPKAYEHLTTAEQLGYEVDPKLLKAIEKRLR